MVPGYQHVLELLRDNLMAFQHQLRPSSSHLQACSSTPNPKTNESDTESVASSSNPIRNSTVITRGILLHGCAGVGKSLLAAQLAEELSSSESSMSTTDTSPDASPASSSSSPLADVWHIQWFTLFDILLRASDNNSNVSSHDAIVAWLMEPIQRQIQSIQKTEHSPEHQKPFQNILIVLDDLHLIEQDDENDKILPEIRTVRAAMGQWIQGLLSATHNNNAPLFFVMGLTRGPPKRLPTSMTGVNALDWHVELEAPRQWQRRDILEALLRQLPLVEDPKLLTDDDGEESQDEETKIQQQQQQERENHQQQIARQWAEWLASHTAGCVAADLTKLCQNAFLQAQARESVIESKQQQQPQQQQGPETNYSLEKATISWKDLVQATQALVPSQWNALDVIAPPLKPQDQVKETNLQQEVWYRQHQESWTPFAGYTTMKRRIYRTIVLPWRKWQQQEDENDKTSKTNFGSSTDPSTASPSLSAPEAFPPPRGVIFHGPSGCGKTVAASYLGVALQLPMIRVRAADVLDKWLGGSEATLRLFFQKARNAAPCILLLDEIDAIATNRRQDDDGATGGVMSRLLSTLLNEMDGVASGASSANGGGVLVVACTNRMERLDAALLRPGRLEEHVEIPLPTIEDATNILHYYFSRPNKGGGQTIDSTKGDRTLFISEDVKLDDLATKIVSEHRSTGATMEGIAREAVLRCIRRQTVATLDGENHLPKVSQEDIQAALEALFLA